MAAGSVVASAYPTAGGRERFTGSCQPLPSPSPAGAASLDRLQAITVIYDELMRQAAMIAYLNDFQLVFWLTLVPIPLVFLIRRRRAYG